MDKMMRACFIQKPGSVVLLKEVHVPKLKEGELLIKVQGSTINPVDRISMASDQPEKRFPAPCGKEGTGKVVETHGETVKDWMGKRVCFFMINDGSWAEYAITTPSLCFQLDEDIPMHTAGSAYINPLTATGFVETYKANGCKGGIIHTAAASSLGRMLNKLCQTEKIPLLNIVKKESHAKTLKNQGATHVIVTDEIGWHEKYLEALKKHHYDSLYDSLGGGPITDFLISHLTPTSRVHLYGGLEHKPLQITNLPLILNGMKIEGFLAVPWWLSASQEVQESVRKHYNEHLKNELKTTTAHEITLPEINKGLELSIIDASKGKVFIKIA